MNALLRPATICTLLAALVALPASSAERTREDSARVRVIHASPDTPSVDVLVNDDLALYSSLRFRDATDYAEVEPNAYNVKVVPAGAGPDQAAIDADLNLFYGMDYTVVAIDAFDEVRALVLADDNSAPRPGWASLRFLHAVPDAPAVDIKVAGGPFLFQNLPFEALGAPVSIPDGRYGLEVRVAGTDAVVVELTDVRLNDGGVYTLLATGLVAEGSLGALLVEDNSEARSVSPVPEIPERPLLGITLGTDDRRSLN